jgi:hypothetical protein
VLSEVIGLPCDELVAVPYTLGLVPERYRAGLLGVAYATSALDFLRCGERTAGVCLDGGDSSVLLKNTSAVAEGCLLGFRNREGVPLEIELPSG